jgi:AraC-like DNA-binding protein
MKQIGRFESCRNGTIETPCWLDGPVLNSSCQSDVTHERGSMTNAKGDTVNCGSQSAAKSRLQHLRPEITVIACVSPRLKGVPRIPRNLQCRLAKDAVYHGQQVKAAAFDAGFKDPALLCRVFNKVYGRTPLSYVRSHPRGNRAAPASPQNDECRIGTIDSTCQDERMMKTKTLKLSDSI